MRAQNGTGSRFHDKNDSEIAVALDRRDRTVYNGTILQKRRDARRPGGRCGFSKRSR
jgi:hypothetical protein